MKMIYPGSTVIHCYVYLTHPHFKESTVQTYILDAAIPSTAFGHKNCFLTCSLHFCDCNEFGFHGQGVYIIEVKVCHSHAEMIILAY